MRDSRRQTVQKRNVPGHGIETGRRDSAGDDYPAVFAGTTVSNASQPDLDHTGSALCFRCALYDPGDSFAFQAVTKIFAFYRNLFTDSGYPTIHSCIPHNRSFPHNRINKLAHLLSLRAAWSWPIKINV
jgi:hypothetical protein